MFQVKEKLLVSVSGGQTSGYMAALILANWSDKYELIFVFANTAAENEETLRFVARIAAMLNIEIIWVEAVVNQGRVASTHRVVNFISASRNYEPFEEVIKKYGIPNISFPHCTRELKLNPIKSYLKSIGWEDYKTAVGIRADEQRRVGKNPKIIYPLVHDWPTTKTDVNEFWESQPFQLGLPDYRGNCKFCYKKSMPKLLRTAAERPQDFDFPDRMEREQGLSGINLDGNHRKFYRKHVSAREILNLAVDMTEFPPIRKDEDAGCSESCEAFTDEE